jgi:flagellin
MVINTNIAAQLSASQLQQSQEMLSKSLGRLSSGSKITTPADDAAGLAVATRLDAQAQRLDVASLNVGNAISFLQTQDGYLQGVAKALSRMSELTILAGDKTKTDPDHQLYQSEVDQLCYYLGDVQTKEFNGVSLFSGAPLAVTIDSEGNTLTMPGIDLSPALFSMSIVTDPAFAMNHLRTAIDAIAQDRAQLGAYQSRLSLTVDQLTCSKENLTAASSRIQDVDVARESTEYARSSILVQSGTAMLAQANQMPQSVLKLLG